MVEKEENKLVIPSIIEGGSHTDHRGTISFVNEFDFAGVERFYMIHSNETGKVRGWTGHRREHKWFSVTAGEVVVAVVKPDDWASPSPDLEVQRFVLSASHPQVLSVPPGFATASVQLDVNATLLVFSSGTLETGESDDFRFPPTLWTT